MGYFFHFLACVRQYAQALKLLFFTSLSRVFSKKFFPFPNFSTFYKFLIINLVFLDNNKNDNLFLISFDQICPNWIKLDQIWKYSTFSTFYKFLIFSINLFPFNDKYGHFVWIRLDQICPKWIKIDQTWSNLYFSLIKKCNYKKLSHLS